MKQRSTASLILLHKVSIAIGHLNHLLADESFPPNNEFQAFIDTAQATVDDFVQGGDEREFWDNCLELDSMVDNDNGLSDFNHTLRFWTIDVGHQYF